MDTAALIDRSVKDDEVAKSIVDHGDKGASDGLEADTAGNLYFTAYEHSAVLKLGADGTWSTVLHGPKLLWPDTLAAGRRRLSLREREPTTHAAVQPGRLDERVPPYQIVRTRVDARPVRLTRTGAAR